MKKMMKTSKRMWFTLIAALLLFTGFMSYPSNTSPKIVEAASGGQVMITSSFEERRGRTVSLSVLVSDIEDADAGSFELHYDADVGYVTEAEKGDAMPEGALFVKNIDQARNGVIKAAWASDDGEVKDGELLTLEFRLMHRNRKNSTDLDLSNVQLFDEDGDPISFNVVDGDVKPFNGKKKASQKNINSNKTWTIKFNTPMNRSTLNPHTITVTDDRTGEKIPVKVKMSKDKKSVTVSPVKHYVKGSYTLTINDQIQSSHGDSLKEAVQLPFTVN
ncbi:Ig-like domain-containing protein [Pontibacillus marinus]|nr:Ig-like domain-containing protein [Pontibacillus marinus]